ncbi:MAG: hypothetical protein IKG23_12420, partial [Clostridia bacterium]|nr:hypothetical protein [Clostridia bacterium]
INSVCSLLRGTQQLYRWDPKFIIQLSVFASDNVQAMQIKEGNVFGTVFKASILNLLKPFLIKMDLDPDYTLAIIDKIAYSVYKKKIRVFSFEVINQVVTEYSDTYKYKCNSVNFTQALVEAQILKEVNQEYCFCHSTYYAFFVAREIRRICQDKHDTSDFVNALKEAYHPINLSIVLFVTYIMDSELLIKQILDGAVASVIDWPEFDPQKPKQTYFNKLEIPKIQLSEGMMVDKQNRQDEQEQKTDIKNQEIWTNPHYFENVDDDTSDVMLRLSLMIIVSQLLPNLGHRITGDDKMKFVQLIYSMPLQIFNKWADEIENDKVSIIQDIKQLGTLEYRNEATREMTDDEAIQYLRQESITILLELMDLSISTASRKTTDDLLDEYDFRSKVGYEIEWLISHEKRRNPKLFITEADKAYRKYKSGLPNVMIKMVVRHYLMNNRVLESRDIQQINQLFFEGKLPQRLLFLDSQEQWKRV